MTHIPGQYVCGIFVMSWLHLIKEKYGTCFPHDSTLCATRIFELMSPTDTLCDARPQSELMNEIPQECRTLLIMIVLYALYKIITSRFTRL